MVWPSPISTIETPLPEVSCKKSSAGFRISIFSAIAWAISSRRPFAGLSMLVIMAASTNWRLASASGVSSGYSSWGIVCTMLICCSTSLSAFSLIFSKVYWALSRIRAMESASTLNDAESNSSELASDWAKHSNGTANVPLLSTAVFKDSSSMPAAFATASKSS